MTQQAIAAIVALILSQHAIGGTIVHVDDDAPAAGDGMSWDTAYRFLQDGLADAVGATEVRVAQGVYLPDRDEANPLGTGDREATFALVDGVAHQGGYLGLSAGKGEDRNERDVQLYETILSGDLLGDDLPGFVNNGENSQHVVDGSGVGETTTCDGFTITAGHADDPSVGAGMHVVAGDPAIIDCAFIDNQADPNGRGGGLYVNDGTVLVSDCYFSGNNARSGAGCGIINGVSTIIRCTFVDNEATRGVGGGLWLRESDPVAGPSSVSDCVFTENNAATGAGFFNFGPTTAVTGCLFERNFHNTEPNFAGIGAGFAIAGPTIVLNCVFRENKGCDDSQQFVGWGGAILGFAVFTAINCEFHDNAGCGIPGGTAGRGGAIYAGLGTLVNCLFANNRAFNLSIAEGGLGSAIEGGTHAISNCTFYGNRSAAGGAAVYAGGTIDNSILWDNVPAQIFEDEPTTVLYSDVDGGWPGYGNIDADPMFVSTASGDFRLLAGSPCIDAGHNWLVAKDGLDLDEDLNTTELVPLDLDDLPRFNADNEPLDPGCGLPAVVDMGAYEFQFAPFGKILFADIDGNGTVGSSDLTQLILNWGPCPGCCLSDLDMDGKVGSTDLTLLILNWS